MRNGHFRNTINEKRLLFPESSRAILTRPSFIKQTEKRMPESSLKRSTKEWKTESGEGLEWELTYQTSLQRCRDGSATHKAERQSVDVRWCGTPLATTQTPEESEERTPGAQTHKPIQVHWPEGRRKGKKKQKAWAKSHYLYKKVHF